MPLSDTSRTAFVPQRTQVDSHATVLGVNLTAFRDEVVQQLAEPDWIAADRHGVGGDLGR